MKFIMDNMKQVKSSREYGILLYNGRVCFRVKKLKFRDNLETLLNTIDKYETKHSNQITITNPVFMNKGETLDKV